jgi:hypothetical protein
VSSYRLTRRAFLAGSLILCVPSLPAGAAAGAPIALLYDPSSGAAVRYMRKLATADTAVRAIEGDRVRFGRGVFTRAACDTCVCVTRHADFLLLSEVAREAGYRLVQTAVAIDRTVSVWAVKRATA